MLQLKFTFVITIAVYFIFFFLNTNMAILRTWSSNPKICKVIYKLFFHILPISSWKLLTSDLSLKPWILAGIQQVGNLYSDGNLSTFSKLCTSYSVGHSNFFKHFSVECPHKKICWSDNSLCCDLLSHYKNPKPRSMGTSCIPTTLKNVCTSRSRLLNDTQLPEHH